MAVALTDGAELPESASDFVGRERELARLAELLCGGGRLITLVGAGGIGKTRLAAEALRRRRRIDPALPVYWTNLVDLERSSDPGAADVLRSEMRTHLRRPGPIGAMASAWDPERVPAGAVLVLDNCEHVLAGVGRLVVELLRAYPHLTIVATSQEPIGWVEEYIVTVPPLRAAEAMELFRRRAERTGRPLSGDARQLADIHQICLHVDRNPLFIQLAAARLRHRPPALVLAELSGDGSDRRLRWSAGMSPDADRRHRGVYDVIAWSFDLCDPVEQLLLERLSIFAAGYETDDPGVVSNGVELDAVVAVCADERLPARAVAGVLERLVERSLVTTDMTATSVRWYLVESVRLFAFDRLRADPATAARVAGRHRRYYRDRAVEANTVLGTRDEGRWLDWVQISWDNILLAMETSLDDPDEAMIGIETAAALLSLWLPLVNSGSQSVIRITEALLEATRSCAPTPHHFRVIALVCWHFLWNGHGEMARTMLERTVAYVHPEHPDRTSWHGSPSTDIGMHAPWDWVWGLDLLLYERDPRANIVLYRAARKFSASDDSFGKERSGGLAAWSAALLAPVERATAATECYMERASAYGGAPTSQLWARMARGVALARTGDPDDGLRLVREVLAARRCRFDNWLVFWAVLSCVTVLDRVPAGRRADRSARGAELAWMIGVFRACTQVLALDVERIPLLRGIIGHATDTATAMIGARERTEFEQRGRTVPPGSEELSRYARGELTIAALSVSRDEPADRPGEPTGREGWDSLSRAEREVAVLAAAGWSNRAIAGRRESSVRTVEAQVASIRQKLMIGSRREIVGFVPPELAEQVEDLGALRAAEDTAGWVERIRRTG